MIGAAKKKPGAKPGFFNDQTRSNERGITHSAGDGRQLGKRKFLNFLVNLLNDYLVHHSPLLQVESHTSR